MRRWMLCGLFLAAAALPAHLVSARAEDKPAAEVRFDTVVREDLFAGFQGDAAALARGVKNCEEALAKNPKNAEALVWRGAARVFTAGQLFGAGKAAQAMPLWTTEYCGSRYMLSTLPLANRTTRPKPSPTGRTAAWRPKSTVVIALERR